MLKQLLGPGHEAANALLGPSAACLRWATMLIIVITMLCVVTEAKQPLASIEEHDKHRAHQCAMLPIWLPALTMAASTVSK